MTLPTSHHFPQEFPRALAISLDRMYETIAQEVNGPSWKLHGTQAVGAGLATVDVVLDPDADRLPMYIFITPDWLTTFRVTAKAVTGFTVDFGTVAPGGGGNIDWLVIHPLAGP